MKIEDRLWDLFKLYLVIYNDREWTTEQGDVEDALEAAERALSVWEASDDA